MKKLITICLIAAVFIIVTVGNTYAQQDGDFYFYSEEDISNIKRSASTVWGQEIVMGMKNVVSNRLRYPMEIPILEGGHGHHYFCPVHNTQFVFDWNSPKAHYCKLCDKRWSGTEIYDWAWVNCVHHENLKFLMANMYLYLITEDIFYANNIKHIFLDLASKYPDYLVHDRERKFVEQYGGKMFGQSLDEAVWIIDAVKAFTVAGNIMTEKEIETVRNGFLIPGLHLMTAQAATNNWQVWHNGAIAALGVALKSDSVIDIALNKESFGYHAMMKKNVHADGWWNEGSVVYHFYPLKSMLLTAETVRCRNINLYDKKFVDMFLSPVNMLYPDLTFPSHNDGWYGISLSEQVSMYEIIALRTQDQMFYDLLGQCYKRVKRKSPEALVNGKDVDTTSEALLLESCTFDNMGVSILRNGRQTVVMKHGPHDPIHGHPDKLSVSIHDGNSEILPDLGTTAYGVPDCQEWYQKTFSHNTITVDGRNQQGSIGVLKKFVKTSTGGIVEAEANEAYEGVEMYRRLELKKNILKDRYLCNSSESHVYDYVLVLTEPVYFGGKEDSLIIRDYNKISSVKQRRMKNKFSFNLSTAQVTVKVNSNNPFTIISGIAPGIPPTGTNAGREAYPFIIRVEGEGIDIETTWRFKK